MGLHPPYPNIKGLVPELAAVPEGEDFDFGFPPLCYTSGDRFTAKWTKIEHTAGVRLHFVRQDGMAAAGSCGYTSISAASASTCQFAYIEPCNAFTLSPAESQRENPFLGIEIVEEIRLRQRSIQTPSSSGKLHLALGYYYQQMENYIRGLGIGPGCLQGWTKVRD